MSVPNGDCHENLFGADFKGSPCHHRVLKPPGGGSSDIFGAPDPAERSPRRVRNHLQSSVLAGGTDTTVNGLETPSRGKPDGNTGGEKITNGEKAPQGLNNGDSLSSNSSTGSASSMSQQRARVPPGGFSSGLW